MRPKIINLTPATADVNNVFEDQTLGGAENFILNGSGVNSQGEWETPDGLAHQISFESAGNLSGSVFTITGYTDSDRHNLITENVTAPNAETVESSNYFYYITSIASDSAVGTNVESGFVDKAVSQPIPVNWRGGVCSVNLDIVGTIDITVQNTFDELQNLDDLNFDWQDSPSVNLVNATTSINDAYDGLPSALRYKINSYSAGATCKATIRQRDI